MNQLHAIVRHVHCLGTHHRFAFDALPMIRTDAGARLASWLLRHYPAYLRGAVDPDTRFRDYHNHIVHVRDGCWGGAPRVAHQWYARLQKHLRAERFKQAAHAAGVLSHYVTDVTQPLHTASDPREALIHRPLEWSIEQSYDRIVGSWRGQALHVVIQLSRRGGWLGSMMLESARLAEKHFDVLVRRYRFQEGIEDPSAGLDAESIRILAELFAVAVTGWARVLERAAAECESETGYPIPAPYLGLPRARAIVTAPYAIWRKRLRRNIQTIANECLAAEYFRTGRLEKWLPAEIDIKQRVIIVRANEKRFPPRRKSA